MNQGTDRNFHRVVLGAAFFFTGFTTHSALDAADAPPKPNVVFIYADNLGYGDLGFLGSKVHRTPHIDRMAKEGLTLRHFYSASGVCTPSRAALMTGCYPQRVGLANPQPDGLVLRPVSPNGLHPNEVTIAEVLKKAGYATACIGKWHLGDQPSFLPTRQGFDTFYGIPYSEDMVANKQRGWPLLPLMENERVVEAPADRATLTQRYTKRAVRFIEKNRDKPFFLYLPHAVPGSVRQPFASKAFRGKSANGPYGDSVEELDWSTGVLLKKLRELGLAKRTLVIFTSDNGTPRRRKGGGSNAPLGGNGYTTSEGGMRVPCVVWWPGQVPAGTHCDELATMMDWLPTLAKLAGTHPPKDRVIDGKDIRPLLFGKPKARSPHKAFFYYQQDQLQAVRSGRWKLYLPLKGPLRRMDAHTKSRRGKLFDVQADLAEKRNLAGDNGKIVKRLLRLAQEARRDLGDLNRPGKGQRKVGRVKNPMPLRLTAKTSQRKPKRDALQSIEGTRGGRHWVDAKTAPPKSPAESLKSLKIEPGFKVQLFASEPLVKDPVAIAFDERGRMFVVEYGDYPTGPPKKGPPLSRVVMLEDRDGDGRADKRHVFADKLNFAHSLMAYRGGLLVGAKTQILFLKDTDGDNRADVREVLFDGFKPAHPQMQIGCPRWGLDNHVYFNYGPGRITSKAASPEGCDAADLSKAASGKTVDMPRRDFRFDPRTMEFGPTSGMGQYGNTVDVYGRRFFCTNRNPIMTAALPYAAMQRNPYAVIPKGYYDVGPSGGETRVYPLVAMKSNYLSHAGTHTSACGVTAYRGAFPAPPLAKGGLEGVADLQRSVFVCEPIGHLVTRSIIENDGVTLTAKRARPKADFLASTDTWFRPASLANGPDGALYVADMYRLWVEHPKFLPPDVAKRLNWRAGDDRGRIYRIVPKDVKPRTFRSPKTTADCVKLLSDPNGWRRMLGQRLLVERQPKDAAPDLRKLLSNRSGEESEALPRLHALWTLEGIGALTFNDVKLALSDPNPFVRKDAVKLAGRDLRKHPERLGSLEKLADDVDVRVRFGLALALGETTDPRATDLLAKLALRDGRDRWFALAVLTSAKDRSGAILSKLLTTDRFTAKGDADRINLVRQLATVVGARGDEDELAALLARVTNSRRPGVWWQTAALSGLANGLPRHRGKLGRTSLSKLIASPPKILAGPMKRINRLLERIAQIAVDSNRSVGDRVAAIPLLAYRPADRTADAFKQLLSSSQPVQVQLAALEAMRAAGGQQKLAEIVLKKWPQLGPSVRGSALAMLLRRTATTRQLLDAMAAGRVKPSVVDIDRRVRLLKHRDERIRKTAEKLFGGAISSNRREVARQYRAALSRKASAAAGFKVFQKSCAKCHKVNGKGTNVGPDISDVRNRSREALLYDILDPNLKVEPRFTEYVVVTSDGRIFNGLMVSETPAAIVLRQPEGKEQVLPRADIERLRASGKSLMPEGVEKDVSIQQMADLLEFLKQPRKPTSSNTKGKQP